MIFWALQLCHDWGNYVTPIKDAANTAMTTQRCKAKRECCPMLLFYMARCIEASCMAVPVTLRFEGDQGEEKRQSEVQEHLATLIHP